MKRLFIIVGLVALVGAAGWTQGNVTPKGTGQWLHDRWLEYQSTEKDSPKEWMSSGVYVGFVECVFEALRYFNFIDAPLPAEDGQVYTVVGTYLDNHSQEWDQPAFMICYRAMAAVWPKKAAHR